MFILIGICVAGRRDKLSMQFRFCYKTHHRHLFCGNLGIKKLIKEIKLGWFMGIAGFQFIHYNTSCFLKLTDVISANMPKDMSQSESIVTLYQHEMWKFWMEEIHSIQWNIFTIQNSKILCCFPRLKGIILTPTFYQSLGSFPSPTTNTKCEKDWPSNGISLSYEFPEVQLAGVWTDYLLLFSLSPKPLNHKKTTKISDRVRRLTKSMCTCGRSQHAIKGLKHAIRSIMKL